MKQKKEKEPIVCVIRDARDVTRDYYITYVEAKQQYEAGKLAFDTTNGCYCLPMGNNQ